MTKPILTLVFCLIASCTLSQTLLQPSQIRVTTNTFPMMTAVGVTNLEQAIVWIDANWHTKAGYAPTNALDAYVSTNVWTNAISSTVTNLGPGSTTNILHFSQGSLVFP